MKLTIESTDKFITTDKGKFRLWIGTTEKGHQCMVLVNGLKMGPDCEEEEFKDLIRLINHDLLITKQSMDNFLSTGLCEESQFTDAEPQDVFAAMMAKAMKDLPEESDAPEQPE